MRHDIQAAKSRLPLPRLLDKLGLGEHAKARMRCPWPQNHQHGDKNPSFSIFAKSTGGWGWKCHAGCGSGDEVTFLEKHFGLSTKDAIRHYCQLAGLNGSGALPSPPEKKAPAIPKNPTSFLLHQARARAVAPLPEPEAGFAEGFAQKLGVRVETIRRLIAEDSLGYKAAHTFRTRDKDGNEIEVESPAIAFACQYADGSIARLHLRGKHPASGERLLIWDKGAGAHLWRLPAAKRADKILLTEGETDAIAALNTEIEADGFAVVAKTGATVFPPEAVEHFHGKTVFVIPDLDKSGREGGDKTVTALREVADVHLVELPAMPAFEDGKPRKDLREWLGLGNGKTELLKLLDMAKLPAADVLTEPTPVIHYGLPKRWCYELGGWIADYFGLFEPRTEPSYHFHLAGALACLDVLLGRRVFWEYGNTRLYPQEYYLLAGRVAAARKSTALNCGARVVRCLETDATPYRMAEGFSYESMPDEFAEWRDRLLLLDEFSALLIQQQKDYGKGIGQTLNSMWAGADKIRLRFRGRNAGNAVVIESPTLTILAATSLELLQAHLHAGDHGGFTSRLLTFYAEGDSKDLPEPLAIQQGEVESLASKLRRLVDSVSGTAHWTPEAARLWAEWYVEQKKHAAANPSGFASRKGDHVRKIALKLEVSRSGKLDVSERALQQAITIADKAEVSWRKVFGGSTGGGGFVASKAGEVLDWLRAHACPEGIPYSTASKALKLPAKDFERVIETLRLWGEIRVAERATGGRPATLIWTVKA